MLSEAPSGTAAVRAAAPVWVAADPDRARETRRRGARWSSRASLFASPVSAFAAHFACLRGCLLAIVFVLWTRIALRDACTTTSPALGAGRVATQEGRRHGQQCFLCRGSRAQCEPRQRFLSARPVSQNTAARRRSVRCVMPAKARVSGAVSLLALGQLRSEAALTTLAPLRIVVLRSRLVGAV